MPQNIREILLDDDLNKLNQIDADSLIKFHDDDYCNIFLFSVRNCSAEITRIIEEKLRKEKKKQRSEFIESDDKYSRGALVLAAIADNTSMLEYLLTNLKFKINFKNKDNKSIVAPIVKTVFCRV